MTARRWLFWPSTGFAAFYIGSTEYAALSPPTAGTLYATDASFAAAVRIVTITAIGETEYAALSPPTAGVLYAVMPGSLAATPITVLSVQTASGYAAIGSPGATTLYAVTA